MYSYQKGWDFYLYQKWNWFGDNDNQFEEDNQNWFGNNQNWFKEDTDQNQFEDWFRDNKNWFKEDNQN